jgi:hypothetical protein
LDGSTVDGPEVKWSPIRSDTPVSRSFSRRKLIGAGGAIALAPIVLDGTTARAAPSTIRTGPVYVLVDPVRVFDSRAVPRGSGGGRLSTGSSIGVPMGLQVGAVSDGAHSPSAVYINITVTETSGAGYLVVRPSDPTGDKPLPLTSNVNWSTSGQTLANLAFVAIGDETYVEVHAGGAGSTHVIIDLQGYIPIPA